MIFMMKRDFFFGSANLNNISIFYIIKFLIKEPFFARCLKIVAEAQKKVKNYLITVKNGQMK